MDNSTSKLAEPGPNSIIIPTRSVGFGSGAREHQTSTTMEEPSETVFWRSEGGSRDAIGASRGNQHTCRRFERENGPNFNGS